MSDKNSKLPIKRFSIRYGGSAGDGLQSTGRLIQKYFNKLGYSVFGFPGTQSTIRGGHIWQHIEFAVDKIFNFSQELDLLIALNTDTLLTHSKDLKDGAILIYDTSRVKLDNYQELLDSKNIKLVGGELFRYARDINKTSTVLAMTISTAAMLRLLGLSTDEFIDTIRKRFVNKEKIIEFNIQAVKKGVEFMNANLGTVFSCEIPEKKDTRDIVVNGNEAIALGAVASGLKFLGQYPITPASQIMMYLSKHSEKFGVVVKQAEDEIAAINMVIGASFAGVRAMTATSGPGISLKTEAIGYAAMTETPLVIVNSMRGGPSTGIPTKMEQSDLMSSIYASHGESPRVVLAPKSIEDAYYITIRAFNLADKYQLPVFILSDFGLSERTSNVTPFVEKKIERGLIWTGPTEKFPVFKRKQITENGVSPRAFPPTVGGEYILVGAEHDEFSNSLSGNRCGLPLSQEIHEKMTRKRFRKLDYLQEELREGEFYGEDNADHTIICWGSTYGAVKEAIDYLNTNTDNTWNMLSFTDIHPLPKRTLKLLERINHPIMFEVNFTGQFAGLLQMYFKYSVDDRIMLLGGEAPTASFISKEAMKWRNK